MIHDRYYLHRTLCDVLLEMRTCCETLNFAPLKGLIEEAQIMGNRMESALGQKGDLREMESEWHRTKKRLAELKEIRKSLEDAINLPSDNKDEN